MKPFPFLACRPAMLRAAFRLTGGVRQEAEDLVQQAYLVLWEKRERVVVETDVEAYCVATVRNVYLNSLRRATPDFADVPVEEAPVALPDAAEDLQGLIELRDAARQMRALIRRLPDAQRAVVTLRDVEGLDFADVARLMGTTEGNVRVLLSRARRTLREQFKRWEDYER